jgi:hypothetical protein
MRTIWLIVLLPLVGAASAAAAAAAAAQFPGQQPRSPGSGYAPQVRIWVDNDRDYFRRGDRMRVSFSSSADAYVAVIHIDSDGALEFLYPSSPWHPDHVMGRRIYTLPQRGASAAGWMVRSGPGIGYLYVVASPAPLDYSLFQGRRAFGWDWSYAGQMVRGDPFWAMEQLTRHLVPGWGFTPVAVSYSSYHVDGLHRHPAYACANRVGQPGRGWGWGAGYVPSYYSSCDRLDPYLRMHPNYFDTRHYRGDRSTFFRDYAPAQPPHRYLEDPRAPRGGGVPAPAPRGTTASPAPSRGTATPAAPAPAPVPSARPATPERGNTSGSGGTTTSEPQRRPVPEGTP